MINISFLIQDDDAIKQKRKSRKLRDVVIFDFTTSLRPFGDENLPKGKFCLDVPRFCVFVLVGISYII